MVGATGMRTSYEEAKRQREEKDKLVRPTHHGMLGGSINLEKSYSRVSYGNAARIRAHQPAEKRERTQAMQIE